MGQKSAWQRVAYGFTTFIMALFGCTGLASASTISGTTGPDSVNTATDSYSRTCMITNNNNVSVTNSSHQTASTGDATSSDNTSAAWAGWATLNPEAAQANGDSFSAWWNSVNSWLSAHRGSSWGGSSQNTSWMPSGSDWNSWDPISWQTNNQSFNNWAAQLSSWMNGNAASWMMSWPADASGGGGFGGTTSGDATNVNTTNFAIHISNSGGIAAASPLVDACGRAVGGSGGGGISGTTGPGSVNTATSNWNSAGNMGNNTGVRFGNGSSQAAYSGPSRSASNTSAGGGGSGIANNGNTTNGSVGVSTPPAGGSGGGGVAPSGANISGITGPDSTNTATSSYSEYTSVTNNNNVSVNNSSWQWASSGSSSSADNTSAGGGGSGSATNGNATGGDIALTN